jgi:hypothetical protein
MCPGDPADGEDLVDATPEEGPTAIHLSWPGGSAEFALGVSGRLLARRFSWLRGKTLDEISAPF